MSGDIPNTYTLRDANVNSVDATKEELETLRSLAAGKHPLTGVSLPDDSCYQSAKVLRALLSAIKVLEKSSGQELLPPNAGQAWLTEEVVELGKCFDKGMTITELARKHRRTEGAIRSRLEKLGKISPLYVSPKTSISLQQK